MTGHGLSSTTIDRGRPWRMAACAAVLAALAAASCGHDASTPSASTPSASPSVPTAPAAAPTAVLGRPTDASIAVSLAADAGTEVYVEAGPSPGTYTRNTPSTVVPAGGHVVIPVEGLAPDTKHYYRVRFRPPGTAGYSAGVERTFRTKRPAGASFTFVIQADPHMDGNSSAAVYAQTLANELADGPDFMFDLGDTSMVEKCAVDGANPCAAPSGATAESVRARFALMRGYFEAACHSVPLFLVIGNHDGEAGWQSGGDLSLDTLAVSARKAFFPNPEPDAFYSGSAESWPGVGPRQNYYAFEWGDALFVVLDPYTYTPRKPGADGWGWTLGAPQYGWLARTLSTSRARYKFVFSHHLLGGNGTDARGGAAFAGLYEWGGRNADGSWGFDRQRPGWPAPIHQLFVDNKVTAWFHGHDHFYAQEQRDGIVYQEVPQPSLARYDTPDPGQDYGYEGTVGVNQFASSGHLRVTVTPSGVRVEYVRSVAPADVTETRRNGAIVTSYDIR